MIINCNYCKATGRKHASYDYESLCPICEGAGKIDVQSIASCNYCKGTGRKHASYEYESICPHCKGTGTTLIKSFQ